MLRPMGAVEVVEPGMLLLQEELEDRVEVDRVMLLLHHLAGMRYLEQYFQLHCYSCRIGMDMQTLVEEAVIRMVVRCLQEEVEVQG
jgi:hypothetical protein